MVFLLGFAVLRIFISSLLLFSAFFSTKNYQYRQHRGRVSHKAHESERTATPAVRAQVYVIDYNHKMSGN